MGKFGELTRLENEIADRTTRMSYALGKNKPLWIALNGEKRQLENEYKITYRNFEGLNESIINSNLAKNAKEGARESQYVNSYNRGIDTSEFNDNIDSMNEMDEEVKKITNEMNDKLDDIHTSFDDEYEKALKEREENRTYSSKYLIK